MDEYTSDIVQDLRDEIAAKAGVSATARYVTCSIQGMVAVLNELDSLTVRLNEQSSKLDSANQNHESQLGIMRLQRERILELEGRLDAVRRAVVDMQSPQDVLSILDGAVETSAPKCGHTRHQNAMTNGLDTIVVCADCGARLSE